MNWAKKLLIKVIATRFEVIEFGTDALFIFLLEGDGGGKEFIVKKGKQ